MRKVICHWLIHILVPAVLFSASRLDRVLSFLTQDREHLQARQPSQARETPWAPPPPFLVPPHVRRQGNGYENAGTTQSAGMARIGIGSVFIREIRIMK